MPRVIAGHGLSGRPLRHIVDQHIMTPVPGKQPVDHIDQPQDLGLDPRLLAQLPQRRIHRPLARLIGRAHV